MSDDLVKRLWLHDCEGITREAADRIEELEAENAKLKGLMAEAAEALEWFIDNDDTCQGDIPLEHLSWRTWNDVNAYWIEGLNRGRAVLAKLTSSVAANGEAKGGKDE